MPEETELIPIHEDETERDLIRDPETVLSKAARAANALMSIVKQKPNPVVFNGRRYIDVNDYQAIGRMFGITAKPVKTEPIEYGGASGFICEAVAIDERGLEVSGATMMCLDDEPNWSTRKGQKVPAFQLMSMAQTRAVGKCLRNVLGFVAVMAGFDATAVEEMTGTETNGNGGKAPVQPPQRKSERPAAPPATNGAQLEIGAVEAVSEKSGTADSGRAWTRYGIKVNGQWHNTFEAELAAVARDAKGCGNLVRVAYEQNGNFRDVTDCVAVLPAGEDPF